MARLGALNEAELTAEQRAVYDTIKAGPRGRVSPPFLAWLRSPNFADRAQNLGAFLRFGTSLPRRVSELAILVTARHWDCAYEWAAHTKDALNAGLAQSVIDSLSRDEVPVFTAEDERAAYAYATSMHAHHKVDDKTYADALAAFGLPGVVELNGVIGYYILMAVTLKSFEIMP